MLGKTRYYGGEALMLHIVVGWVRDLFGSSDIEVVEEIDVPVTRSQLGYKFQRHHFEQLFNGISDWPRSSFLMPTAIPSPHWMISARGRTAGLMR